MADKRGKWTKEDKDLIWKNYVNKKIYDYFEEDDLNEFDLNQECPCPFAMCEGYMLKAQYQGKQPNKDYSWDIDHINGNPKDNRLENLQPMHPWCNKEKSRIK